MILDDDIVSKMTEEDECAPYDGRRVVSHEEVEQPRPSPRGSAAGEDLRQLAGERARRRGGCQNSRPHILNLQRFFELSRKPFDGVRTHLVSGRNDDFPAHKAERGPYMPRWSARPQNI